MRKKVESGMRSAEIQVRPGAEGPSGVGGAVLKSDGWGGGGHGGQLWPGRRKGQARGLRSHRQPSGTNGHADGGEGA